MCSILSCIKEVWKCVLFVEGVINNCGIQTKECSLTACELISGRADRWLIHLKVIVHSSVVGHVCCVRE